ncbi:MAG: tRNA pseudouridine(55) synthase TruB [Myxococcales bacterium]|nr:tRNA pseudouridine(55) synthase TruB [Myxococcales bacterium]
MSDGVVVVDKPAGATSHDIVARARRAFGTRRVGHAGTLDPMATGVLVVMVGEGTKLAPFLTADDKTYAATVSLGRATDTLDAEGEETASAPLPAWWHDAAAAEVRLGEALEAERARRLQAPPVYSAIKVGGRSAHARVRAGEEVDLAEREVVVRALELTRRDVERGELELRLDVGKGYYVRALARDLGERLGVPAHLVALRRLTSGAFGLADALPGDASPRDHLLTLEEAATRALAVARLTEAGVARARCGGPMKGEDFVEPPPAQGLSAWLAPDGHLVAIGELREGRPAVRRGIVGPPEAPPRPEVARLDPES